MRWVNMGFQLAFDNSHHQSCVMRSSKIWGSNCNSTKFCKIFFIESIIDSTFIVLFQSVFHHFKVKHIGNEKDQKSCLRGLEESRQRGHTVRSSAAGIVIISQHLRTNKFTLIRNLKPRNITPFISKQIMLTVSLSQVNKLQTSKRIIFSFSCENKTLKYF